MTSAANRGTAPAYPEIPVMGRRAFLDKFRKEYQQGQHVTFLGPTQRGKTTFSHQMLGAVVHPRHKCVILGGKPPGRDGRMDKVSGELNLRQITTWPPLPRLGDRKRNGFVLRPEQSMHDLDADEANLRDQFKAAILANYRAPADKPVITVVDEGYQLQNDLKLKKEYEAPLMRGAPVNAVWSLIQRGRYVSYHAYGAPEYVVIFNDPDLSNQKRYSEIGGVDPRYVAAIVSSLKTETVQTSPTTKGTISECLVIKRSGPEMMIVSTR